MVKTVIEKTFYDITIPRPHGTRNFTLGCCGPKIDLAIKYLVQLLTTLDNVKNNHVGTKALFGFDCFSSWSLHVFTFILCTYFGAREDVNLCVPGPSQLFHVNKTI